MPSHDMIKRSIIIILFLIILIKLLFIFRKQSKSGKTIWLVILFTTVISSAPLFLGGLNNNGHDLLFHLFRIEGIVHEYKTGHFPARIYSMWVAGHGYPAPIYYGDILLYFPAALRMFGFSMNFAFKAHIVFVNLLTAITSFVCFKKIFNKETIAEVLTFVFCLNTYRMTDLYIRYSVGEFSAMIFFPIITLAVYRIYSDKNHSFRQNICNSLLLSLGMTGVVTSHTLSVLMVSYTLLLVFILLFKKSFTFNVIRSYIIAVAFTFISSAFFLIPMLDYFRKTTIYSDMTLQHGVHVQEEGVNISWLFDFFTSDPGSFVQLTPGMILMLTLLVSIFLWVTRKSTKELKFLTVVSILLLFLTTKYFPWDAIADINYLKTLTQVQYPWRYIGIACMFLTLMLGNILSEIDTYRLSLLNTKSVTMTSAILSVAGVVIFTLLFAGTADLHKYGYAPGDSTYYPVGVAEYKRAKKIDDYSFYLTDYTRYSGGIEGDFSDIEVIKNEGLNLSFYVKNKEKDTEVILPRTNYPGYHVKDENNHSYDIYDSDNLLVAFTLPADYEGNIYLTYDVPWYWNGAMIISLLSIILSVILHRKIKSMQS